FLPVYANDVTHATLDERRANLVGWVAAAVDLAPLFCADLCEPKMGVAVTVSDADAAGGSVLLFESDGEGGLVPGGPRRERTLPLLGRRWTLAFAETPAFAAAGSPDEAWVVFGLGVLISVLVTGLLWSFARTHRRALSLAREMTAALSRSEAETRRHLA